MVTTIFPSAYEATNKELMGVSESLVDGIKIRHNQDDYIVGNLALQEGISPQKNINTGPEDKEYLLLIKAAMLSAIPKGCDSVNLTLGFPFSTYMLYRDSVKECLKEELKIVHDVSTYMGNDESDRTVKINQINVIPEIQGCITAIRKGAMQEKRNFFIISLGFGTCEAVFSTPAGMNHRTSISMNGVRYAIKLLENELSKKFYLNLKTEHQLDHIFKTGWITINRVRHNICDLRKKVLETYYKDEISPRLRRAFSDDEFNKSTLMYIVGGGAHYPELMECFQQEFGSFLTISNYPEPEKCAAHGYCLYSESKQKQLDVEKKDDFSVFDDFEQQVFAEDQSAISVGIDIGNANTCISIIK